jgi:parallel beta-helix repeat protein
MKKGTRGLCRALTARLLALPLVLLTVSAIPAYAASSPITLNADYVLMSDMTFDTTGFIIAADGITLDLNGHTITGAFLPPAPAMPGNYGIRVEGHHGVTIKNGTVTGFVFGVEVRGSDNVVIENIVSSNNGLNGINLYGDSDNNQVRDCTSTGNFAFGILVNAASDGNLIDHCTLTGNASTGVFIGGSVGNAPSNNNTVIDSNCSSSINGVGINIVNSAANLIVGNTLSNNPVFGIILRDGAENNAVVGNIISSSGRNGIVLLWADNNQVRNNTVSNSDNTNLVLTSASNNTVYNNSFVSTKTQALVEGVCSGNLFNLDKPVGGNYWSNWNSPDSDADGFVDSPYVFTGGQDNLPWAVQDGWLDTVAPTSAVALTGTLGTSGWYTSNVQVALTATENAGGSGVKEIHYTINGSPDTTVPGASVTFTLTNEGTNNLTYFATDNAGNIESTEAQFVKIDKTPPAVTYTGNMGTYAVDQKVNITCAATDTVSGIASSTCQNIIGPAYSFPLGINVFSATATDNAGNLGSGSTSFTVQVTCDSLSALVRQFVTKHGIVNSLLAKLDHAKAKMVAGPDTLPSKAGIIGAFINEVEAQSGKALSKEHAAILIALAKDL